MPHCRKCDGEHVEGHVYCMICHQAGRVAVFMRVVVVHGSLQLYCGTCGLFAMQTVLDPTHPEPPAYPEGMPCENLVTFTTLAGT